MLFYVHTDKAFLSSCLAVSTACSSAHQLQYPLQGAGPSLLPYSSHGWQQGGSQPSLLYGALLGRALDVGQCLSLPGT